jgi:PAS domain S-box-containing protein
MEQALFSSAEYIELFFDVFETSSDAIYITRVDDGVILDANDTALSLFGFVRSEAMGHCKLELGLWARPADRAAFIEALRAKGRVRRYPVRLRTKSSEEFTLELSATATHLRGEEVILGVGVLPKPA